jgi:hypothetical protein
MTFSCWRNARYAARIDEILALGEVFLVPTRWMEITALALVFLMPASGMAATTAGMIHVSGTDATLDGRSCSAVNVGYDGERLATGANSKATITSRGAIASLSSNTSVRLGARALELLIGSVVVSSDAGSSTKVENLTLSTPTGMHAKFLAQRSNGELQLLALEGRVDVSDGQETTPVPAGTGAKIKLPKSSTSAGGSSGSSGHWWTWLTNDDIGILIVVAAAIAAGVTLGVVNSANAAPLSAP